MAPHSGIAVAMQVWQERLWAVAQALWAAAHPEGLKTLLQSLLTLFQCLVSGMSCRVRHALHASISVCCVWALVYAHAYVAPPVRLPSRGWNDGATKSDLLSAVARGCAEGAGRLCGPGWHRGQLLGPGAQAVRGADVCLRRRRRVVPFPG